MTCRGGLYVSLGGRDTESELKHPCGVTVDGEGNIVVTDTLNHRVQVFDIEGRVVRVFGRQGNDEGELHCPYGVSVGQHREMT